MKQKKQSKTDSLEGSPPQESNQYDKVLKEAFREALPVLLTDILKIPVGQFKPVHIEMQRTIERKADFIGKSLLSGVLPAIVHLEVQARYEKHMVIREYLYSGLILQQYPDWELLQWVFFIGKKRPTMPTRLKRSGIDYHFNLIWIKEIPYKSFLETGKQEIMLLAALADYGGKTAKEVMTQVVNEIRQITQSELDFQHYVQQLHILSNLHKLQHIFAKIMSNISELIDERKDPFFQRGEKIGLEQGLEQGLGRKSMEVIINLILHSDHADNFISAIAGVHHKDVTVIRKIISEHPENFQEFLTDFKFTAPE